MTLVKISRRLSKEVDQLQFSDPVAFVYNPLSYARTVHESYLKRFGAGPKEAVFLGMNPGPFGMAQTGVPFGDPTFVRDWMGLRGKLKNLPETHPKRPLIGLDSPRSEVSGSRLWGWARERFGEPEAFFARFFVVNYCPLVFMEASSRNRVPEKLAKDERVPLFEACDRALRDTVSLLKPKFVVGVGKFAEERARKVLGSEGPMIGRMLHPSPASPKANRGWARLAEEELHEIGVL